MAEIEWQGHSYLVSPNEPPQQRGLELCHPFFAAAASAWLIAANTHLGATLPGRYTVYPGETRRSLERQVFLYAIGRVIRTDERIRSKTLDSKHRWGLAVDLYAVDNLTGELNWDDSVGGFWAKLYEAVPPRAFGLTDIRPLEFVHLELQIADELIARAAEFGLEQS